MKRYRIWEKMLTEVIGGSDMMLIGEVEASSINEAHRLSRMMFPNRATLRLDDCGQHAIEFHDERAQAPEGI